MRTCSFCGEPISETTAVCGSCGRRVTGVVVGAHSTTTRICQHCGFVNTRLHGRCAFCKKDLDVRPGATLPRTDSQKPSNPQHDSSSLAPQRSASQPTTRSPKERYRVQGLVTILIGLAMIVLDAGFHQQGATGVMRVCGLGILPLWAGGGLFMLGGLLLLVR